MIPCEHCDGLGKIGGPWIQEISNWSIDRLRFEYEKRQREIQRLEIMSNELERQYDEAYYNWEDRYEDVVAERGSDAAYNICGKGPERPDVLNSYAKSIGKFEEEMAAIEQVMNTKW